MLNGRIRAVRFAALLCALGLGWIPRAHAFSNGISTLSFGSSGCNNCHTGGTPPVVTLSGPTLVAPGSTAEYTLRVSTVGSQTRAGMNASMTPSGTLGTGGPDAANTRTISGPSSRTEVTHNSAKPASAGTVAFSFLWNAPSSFSSEALRVWGNAVNGNGSTSGDRAALATLTVTAPTGSDLYMRDTPSDNGNEANSGIMWTSEDIWNRTSPIPGYDATPFTSPFTSNTWPSWMQGHLASNKPIHDDPEHRDPLYSTPNYLYVLVSNKGQASTGGERLRVYWAKASTGLAWPTQWVDYVPGANGGCASNLLYGIEITKPRRNAATLSPTERAELVADINALDALYFNGDPDSVSFWDKYDQIHRATHGHCGPAFLPWHRELINRFEQLLRKVDPTVTLPYWDWTTDPVPGLLGNPSFMGASNGRMGSPFDTFDNNGTLAGSRDPVPLDPSQYFPGSPPALIERSVGTSCSLSSTADDTQVLSFADYPTMRSSDYTTGTSNVGLEGIHDNAHCYIGGTLGDERVSFQDPFVFLLHSETDRLFAKWQRRIDHLERLNADLVYGSDSAGGTDPSGICHDPGHPGIDGITTLMEPWNGGSSLNAPIFPWTTISEYVPKTSKDPSVVSPPYYDDVPLVIPQLQPGQSAILQVPWYPPKPGDFEPCFPGDEGHVCLLARIETQVNAPYGMQFPETADLGGNVANNNNIIWRNVNVEDMKTGSGKKSTAIVRNVEGVPRVTKLVLTVPAAETDSSFFQRGTVLLDLGTALYQKWVAGGSVGASVTPVTGSIVRVQNPGAYVGNITLDPGELHAVSTEVRLSPCKLKHGLGCEGGTFNIDLQQWSTILGNDHVVGGVRYELHVAAPGVANHDSNQCLAGKTECVSEKMEGLLACHVKAEKSGTAVAPLCTQSVRDEFEGGGDPSQGCFEMLEAVNDGPCLTFDDTSDLENRVDAFVLDVVEALDPAYPSPIQNPCSAAKKRCVERKATALLACHQKAMKRGLAVDGACLQKAHDKFDGAAKPNKGCFAKLEAKGGCLTAGDVAALEAKVDAFVDGVVCALDPQSDICTQPTPTPLRTPAAIVTLGLTATRTATATPTATTTPTPTSGETSTATPSATPSPGPTATASLRLSKSQLTCQIAIAKEGLKFLSGELRVRQQCATGNLTSPGSCPAPDAGALLTLRARLRAGLAKRCDFTPASTTAALRGLGFPGPCTDADPGDGFTLADLQDCIEASHEHRLTGVCGGGTNLGEACTVVADCPDSGPGTFCRGIISIEYDPTLTGPLAGTAASCQKVLALSSSKFLLTAMKSLQRCRNDLLNCKIDGGTGLVTCRLSGFLGKDCATADDRTIDAIAKAKSKAEAAIVAKCSPSDVVLLEACEPDQPTPSEAAACEIEEHRVLADNADPTAVDDLLDFQYATRGRCGDNRLNQASEECDGGADAACPGLCGAANGFFACLCQNVPRQRVVEHANADLDTGWTGTSHDLGVVEGGGYVTDLWDCDGPGGPDTLCTVGPSCNLAPHQPCSPAPNATDGAADSNSVCLGGGNFCRRTAGGSTGPHCEIEFHKRCETDAQCPLLGDRCIEVLHSAPLPVSAAGIPLCVVNVLSEDVVGTTDLATGSGAVRLRQRSLVHAAASTNQPCPVCGGFCAGLADGGGPGARTPCASDLDCPDSCITDHVCSFGPNADHACRPDPPFGGGTAFFGNPSVDCPPFPDANLSGRGLDLLLDPATTATTSLSATQHCTGVGFAGKACVGGGNDTRPCTAAGDCPGGACNEQCFCPAVGGTAERPNSCDAACVGGAFDAAPCGDDSQCDPPNGFCHPGDCRLNPADTDSAEEGLCTTGPAIGTCSTSSFKPCNADAQCQGTECPFCQPGETCVVNNQQCFLNGQVSRAGTPGSPDRVSAALFCLGATNEPSIDDAAGLPGPGALTQPTTTIEVGF